MGLPAATSPFSFNEFLVWLDGQAVRHEFMSGEVFAMAGGTAEHASAILNLGSALSAGLRGTACRAFVSDMLVRIEAADAAYSPDVLVTCEDIPKGTRFLIQPKLVLEVLSASTEAFDRGRKFQDFQMLTSLEEYVLVDTDRHTVERFRQSAEGWRYEKITAGDVLFFSVGIRVSLDEMFR
jgi:Uma2 family endonuclease